MNTALRARIAAMPSRLVSRRCVDALLFVFFALALIAANRTAIATRNVEYGDFAANGLLIQVAKTGQLLVGNYSRVGFNHPGPAILDVLAAGEVVFFDLLHWVPSPFSGQLVGVAFYNAFWMILIVRLWRRLTVTRIAALSGAAVFFVAAASLDVRFYSGPWFPHLYFFPFATFLMAAARLGQGRSDSILSLALGAGFLIDGHVAFAPITVIVLTIVLAANRLEYRKVDASRVVLGLSWWTTHRRALLMGISTVFVFCLPLAIETLRRFPHPLADYFTFGSGHGRNSFKASLRFVAMYWGGLPFIVVPAAFVVVTWRHRLDDAALSRAVRSSLAAIVAASIAVLLYAVFGVDMLYATYIGYFYCSVPAFVVAIGAVVALQSTASRRSAAAVGLLAILAFAVACAKLSREPDYTALYRGPAIESLDRSLASMPRDGRLVFDLEPETLTTTWPVVVGIELVAMRRGDEFFCVGENWHILFTTRARCTADEVRHGAHVVVRGTSQGNPSQSPWIVKGMGVSFFRKADPSSATRKVSTAAAST